MTFIFIPTFLINEIYVGDNYNWKEKTFLILYPRLVIVGLQI